MRYLIFILLCCTNSLHAQLSSISTEKLYISFDKTLHLIFSDNIKYYEKGSDVIAANVDGNCKNIVRIKAVEEGFPGETNISIVLANGSYYSYDIAYSSNIITSSYNVSGDSLISIPSDYIQVNTTKLTHLMFPHEIKYIDYGNNEALSVNKAEATKNILRIQGLAANFPPTSLSVVTTDNKYYAYNIGYSETIASHTYKIGKSDAALFEKPNSERLADICSIVDKKPSSLFNIGLNKMKMSIIIKGLYIKNNILYMQCELENSSSINYNIDFIKYTIKDKKQRKNTSVQEDEMQPLYTYNVPTIIKGKDQQNFVIALPKFTIPDQKVFLVSIFEKDGGRHLEFTINNSSIISATAI